MTELTCGGIFNNRFIANCLENAPVEKFFKSVNICQNIDNHIVGRFLGHSVGYIRHQPV